MKIGIDISQLAFSKTGVAKLTRSLVEALLKKDTKNEYILFYSSFRRPLHESEIMIPTNAKCKIRHFPFPPTFLDILWNKLHLFPIECFIGDVDVFISSDWTEPPTKKAKKATILYDLTVYVSPQETDEKIIKTQKRKLNWVQKESDIIFCISEATKKDAMRILNIEDKRLKVVYPGV